MYWLSHRNKYSFRKNKYIVRHIVDRQMIEVGEKALCQRTIYMGINPGYKTYFSFKRLGQFTFITYDSICKNCLKKLPIDDLNSLRQGFIVRKLKNEK